MLPQSEVSYTPQVSLSQAITRLPQSEVSHIPQVSLSEATSQLSQSAVSQSNGRISTERNNQSQNKVAETTSAVQFHIGQGINHPDTENRRHPSQAPLMSYMQSGTPLPPGPTPVRYAHSDAQVLPPTHRLASSTVSFMTRPQEIVLSLIHI